MKSIARSEIPAAPSGLRIEELMKPSAYPHPVTRLELRETHISWVILTGTFAYKIKKPVKLDFIDASSLENRLHYCQEELRLNRRLAPELYLDIVTITRIEGRLCIGGAGPIVEYAVRMKQFASADELTSLLSSGVISAADVRDLGELLASFHRDATVAPGAAAHGNTQQVYDAVLGNLAQLLAHLPAPLTGLGKLVEWTHDSARTLESFFELRAKSGFIRECHGDLHAANIVRLQRRLVPFDCLDFNPQLRWIDVINDIAFLVMDLASYRRYDLAFALISRYLEISGDYAGVRLLPFYAVYRALVRAKVDVLMAEQFPHRADEFRERLRRRVAAAQQWIDPQRPVLILMHGVSGSGKSWLSERLVAAMPAIRVRSDLERKRLTNVDTHPSAAGVGEGLYAPELTHRTYARLSDCAESCLRAGFSTIVDATLLDRSDRDLFHGLAEQLRVSCVIVSCQADPATLTTRILERQRDRNDASDAGLAVLDAQLRTFQSLDTLELPRVVVADTNECNAAARVTTAIRALCAT